MTKSQFSKVHNDVYLRLDPHEQNPSLAYFIDGDTRKIKDHLMKLNPDLKNDEHSLNRILNQLQLSNFFKNGDIIAFGKRESAFSSVRIQTFL